MNCKDLSELVNKEVHNVYELVNICKTQDEYITLVLWETMKHRTSLAKFLNRSTKRSYLRYWKIIVLFGCFPVFSYEKVLLEFEEFGKFQ